MPRVAVIGAGFAGLRCSDVLVRNGAKVTVFEARNRVGGRVLQHTAGDYTFDMGPNWIHGTEGNPMMKLAEKTGTVILEPEEKQIVFDCAGNMKSEKEALELAADTWASIANAFNHSNEHCADIDPQTSLLDYFKDELVKRFPNDKYQVQERVNEARMWGPFVGDPIDRQSLKNFFLEECLEGENVVVASTYNKILAEVARRALQYAEVRLEEEVTNIEYNTTDNADGKVKVTTVKGECTTFDEVVVTCPLGWLKVHKEAFSPKLPQRLSQAIDNISYGHLEKIYATFPSAWWKSSSKSMNGAPNGTNAHHSSVQTTATPLFVHFHHPSYHPNPASKMNEFWNQAVVSLAHFPDTTAQPTLLFYMYGPCSLYMTSMIKEHEPGSQSYNSLLYDFLHPFVSRLPNFSAADPTCTPISLVATQWSNDPFSGHGSYSNFQIGLQQGDEDIECMRNAGGLSDEGSGLWFAGEHTAPFVAIGTTTGAYWSGEAVARRILRRYDVEDVDTGDDELDGKIGEGSSKAVDPDVKDGANLTGLAI